MSEFKSSNFRNEDNSGAPDIVGVTTFTSPYYFVPPSGTTAERPSGDGLAPGMLRFNTDIGRLEVWRGDHWAMILGESPNLGVNGALGARGVISGGGYPTGTNTIEYITISTLGNSSYFGDLTQARSLNQGFASSTRGITLGGTNNPTTIDYITISSTGNAINFGNQQFDAGFSAGLSNATRGIMNGLSATLDYVTIASTGNAVNFGTTFGINNNQFSGQIASSTRGIFSGGAPSGTAINYVTISTLGSTQNFGSLSTALHAHSGGSNSTRGIYGGGSETPTNIIYLQIATLGNTQDFGDLTVGGRNIAASASATRLIFAGRGLAPTASNTIDYVTISTLGNAVDFGDISSSRGGAGFSNAHGGL
jgi:hypothetical protein